ncbi:recombinase family protein [Epilithonimonas caeni]|uniref:recombinase family protein n=1 Tax=Epilithonimonas caeni TaxID=365343 RepID=UPI0003FCE104|nr:recombinase family protein [Epilithonimonas caeni]
MRIKYNRVSTLLQTGKRFEADTDIYDLVLLDKISGSVSFADRPKSKELIKLIEQGKVSEIVVEEFSRLGRNTGDVIKTLEWFDAKEINVLVKNIGLQSRTNGKRNPIWKMISATLSSLYEMEALNIRERTLAGKLIFLQQGGRLGRPKGTGETELSFISKPKNKKILEYLKKERTLREISILLNVSTKTVQKVKKVGQKFELI